jgi:hypothetical protein
MNLAKFILSILLLQIGTISGAQDAVTLEDGTKAFRLKDGNLFIGELIEGKPHGLGSSLAQSSGEVSVGKWSRGLKEGIFLVHSKVREPSYQLFRNNDLIYEAKIRSDWSDRSKNRFRAGSKNLRWKVYELEYFEEINLYDDKGVTVSGEVRNVWELTDFVNPQQGAFFNGALSRLSNIEFNCAKGQIRALSATWFADRQRGGSVLNIARYEHEGHPDSKWQRVIPQTAFESLYRAVCKKQ